MKRLFRLDGFGAGCFGLIAVMIVVPLVIYLVL